jgi:hypothetical protein
LHKRMKSERRMAHDSAHGESDFLAGIGASATN